jgi:hypothetical protein
MSAITDAFKAIGKVIMTNQRLEELYSRVDTMDGSLNDTRERLARVEAFVELVTGQRARPRIR